MQNSPRLSWLSLAACLLITFAAGAVGAIASVSAPEFYTGLSRPSWAPPPSVFGPVWSVLYLLMGVALWLVWREARLTRGLVPYLLFAAQLALNALWTWLFFAWQRGAWAFFEIVVLALLIAATALKFKAIRPLAAALLLPYLAWVCFATALTYSVWRLNPGSV